jgi:hypothetical protein
MLSRPPTSVLLTLLALLFLAHPTPTNAVKFALQAYRYPPSKCIWNAAHMNALVIVTANVAPGLNQRVDIEIIDSSPQKNVYLHKKNINGETRLAITSHAEGEVGVCFKNHLDHGTPLLVPTVLGLWRSDKVFVWPGQILPHMKRRKARAPLIWMSTSAQMPWITSTPSTTACYLFISDIFTPLS